MTNVVNVKLISSSRQGGENARHPVLAFLSRLSVDPRNFVGNEFVQYSDAALPLPTELLLERGEADTATSGLGQLQDGCLVHGQLAGHRLDQVAGAHRDHSETVAQDLQLLDGSQHVVLRYVLVERKILSKVSVEGTICKV